MTENEAVNESEAGAEAEGLTESKSWKDLLGRARKKSKDDIVGKEVNVIDKKDLLAFIDEHTKGKVDGSKLLDFYNQIQELQRRLEGSEEERTRVEMLLEKAKDYHERMTKAYDELRLEREDLLSSKMALETRLGQAQATYKELADLHKQLQDVHEQLRDAHRSSQEQVAQLDADQRALQAKHLMDLERFEEAKKDEFRGYVEELEEGRVAREQLRQSVEKRERLVQSVESQKEALQADFEKLKAQLESLDASEREKLELIRDLQEKLRLLRRETTYATLMPKPQTQRLQERIEALTAKTEASSLGAESKQVVLGKLGALRELVAVQAEQFLTLTERMNQRQASIEVIAQFEEVRTSHRMVRRVLKHFDEFLAVTA